MEIKQAIDEGALETRGMDEHLNEIKEWLLEAGDQAEAVRRMREYHAKRVAFFVVNGWPDDDPHPITINAQNQVTSGNHRFRAARYLGLADLRVMLQ